VTVVSDLEKKKALSQITSTEAGRWIETKPHHENTRFSSRVNFEGNSNEIDSSDRQELKQSSEITKTEAGRWSEVRPLCQNADRSNRDNFESDEIEIDVSISQFEKHDS
jgi:hypothetical protein